MTKINKRRRFLMVFTVLGALLLFLLLFISMDVFKNAAYPTHYKEYVEKYADEYGVDPALVFAVIRTESSFRSEVSSHASAMGLMQITEPTFFFICEKARFKDYVTDDLFDPEINIRLGTFFLSYLIDDFGFEETALAAYNAGRGSVQKWLKNEEYSIDGLTLKEIPYNETRNYVRKVMSAYEEYKKYYD